MEQNEKLKLVKGIGGGYIRQVDWEQLLASQDGHCAICKVIPKRYDLDHDHLTGVVRGFLCIHCNVKLGIIEKQSWEDWLKSAMSYLERAKSSTIIAKPLTKQEKSERRSRTTRAAWADPEKRKRMGTATAEGRRRPEAKAKFAVSQSKAQKLRFALLKENGGIHLSEEHKQAISRGKIGAVFSDDHRRALSIARRAVLEKS